MAALLAAQTPCVFGLLGEILRFIIYLGRGNVEGFTLQR